MHLRYERLPHWYTDPLLQKQAYENYVRGAKQHDQRLGEPDEGKR